VHISGIPAVRPIFLGFGTNRKMKEVA